MERIEVKERGRVDYEGKMYTPQNMAFPSAISALKVFMGLGMRTTEINAHNMTWVGNLDYYFQVGVSTEGFGLFYDLPHSVLKNNLFSSESLKDCLAAEGLPYKLYGDNSVQIKDGQCNTSEEFIEVLTEHLSKNLTAIVLSKENIVILATGYENNGDTLRGWVFMDGADNTNKSFNPDYCQFIDDWTETTFAILLVFEPVKPDDRREICIKALKRGYEMLNTIDFDRERYGYGKALYRNWINYIFDDKNFGGDVTKRPYIDPEIWDLAEKRAWAANFMREAEGYLGRGVLVQAIDSFMAIHDKMWEINRLCSGENAVKLKDREIRLKIVDIIRECGELDEEAAKCIGKALFDKSLG
jgi:hypothetical protein